MVLTFLTAMLSITIMALAANAWSKKSDEEYDEYRRELAYGKQVETYKKKDGGVHIKFNKDL